MGKTTEDLQEAFAGESQANRKYLAYARQADKEGYHGVARLFRASAAAETVHAHAHLGALGGISDTAENLRDAVAGETHEFKSMYPDMIERAQSEGMAAAERSFTYANEVEKIHAALYQAALDQIDNPSDIDCYYVCSVCGNTVENEPPEICPICNARARAFERID